MLSTRYNQYNFLRWVFTILIIFLAVLSLNRDVLCKTLSFPVNPDAVREKEVPSFPSKEVKGDGIDETTKAQIQESYGKLPLYFIQNDGQVDERVKFYEKGSGHATFFTKEGVYISLVRGEKLDDKSKKLENTSSVIVKDEVPKQSPPQIPSPLMGEGQGGGDKGGMTSQIVRLTFLNANPNPEIIAVDPQEGKVNYFIGNDPENWRTSIPTYQAVVYKEVYHGIDIKFYGNNRQMEYDIIVKPGGDPSKVKFAYEGIKGLRVTEEGDLEISLHSPSLTNDHPLEKVTSSFPLFEKGGMGGFDDNTEGNKIIQKKPIIYQEIVGKRVSLEGRFKILGNHVIATEAKQSPFPSGIELSPFPLVGEGGVKGEFAYTFELASYDKAHPLVIDPVLVYSTYLGGGGYDYGIGIAVDGSGNVYVTGSTNSTDFPTTLGAYDTTHNSASYGWNDVFVSKLNALGTTLIYSTFIGGHFSDFGFEIAVDSLGNSYVTGDTGSSNFPTTPGVFDTTYNNNIKIADLKDIFVLKLNATGSALIYSTFIGGGNGGDYGGGITLDSLGNVYVAGSTDSSDFPTVSGAYDKTFNGGSDVFVLKLNSTGSSLIYSTFIGGTMGEGGSDIALDGLGNAYVTGATESGNFPTTLGAYDNTLNSGYDVFVAKLNGSGTALVYSTYLGGGGDDYGYEIAVDGSGNAYVTGQTGSTNFPVSPGAYDTTINGGYCDAFVTKLDGSGSAMVYSTYLGGSSSDYGYGIAVDGSGNVYVTGFTNSTNFPVTPGAYDTTYNGDNYDVFVTKFSFVSVYSILGQITENTAGLGGVTMTLSGAASAATTTASDGTYSFTGLADGSYTVTPGKNGYFFDPPDRPVTVAGSDITGIDFSASPCTPLFGILLDATTNKGLSGVEIKVDGSYSTTTASDGSYSFSCIPNGKHTVTVAIPSGYAGYSRTIDLPLNSTWNIKLTKEQTVNGTDTSSGYSADPVNTATGNYTYQRKDIEIPGISIPFVFERSYNSRDTQDGSLGFGWSHSYNTALTVNPDTTVTIRWGDGKTETWTPDGMGGFTPQYGVFDTLIDNGDGTHTLKKKDLIRYNFDSAGRLASIVDKNGNSVSLTYTGANLTQVTDTAGRVITFTYDANNRITLITDPILRTIQFSYDANGDLVSATDMDENPTQYTYDVNHQMLTATDPRQNTFVTNVYDDAKRVVVSQKDAKLGITLYLYDEVDRKTTIFDQLGNPTIHYHDELLRLIQEKDARGYSTYYTYDEAGNRTEVKDKNGNLTKYAYDAKGNVTSKTDALNIVTAITYDTNNNPLSRTEAVGTPLERNTTFEYDANGNLSKTTDPLGKFTTITYDAHGLPLTITDPKGNTTTNTYDTAGNLTEVTNALVKKTTYTYDGVGRRLTTTDALLRTTTYTYDNNNNLLTVTDPIGTITYTYDKNNNKVTVKDKKGKITQYSYDVKDLPETITDPYNKTVTYTYDALDRKKTITDKNGNQITYDYDAVGNLIKVIDPYLKETTFTYDGNGNKLTETDPLIHTMTYKYDVLNRITDITDPLGNTTVTTYDELGRVFSTTNAKLQTTFFEYDALGRLTKVSDADTGTVQYTYDENGNRLTQTDPNTNTTQYEYDVLNRLIRKTEPYGQHEYWYDDGGNMTSRKDPKGNVLVYKYDALNRLEKITYPDTTFVSYTYDVNDNRIGMTDSLGASTYTYDDLNRMTSYTDPFGKIVGYGYDNNGNRTSMTYPDGKVVNYSYDKLNRLWTVTDWLGKITTYSYDDAGNLSDILNPNNTKVVYAYDTADRLTGLSNTKSDSTVISSYTYTLDAIGNHENTAQNEPLIPIIPSQNVTYTHDAENRMTDAGGVTNTFDTNGNMTARGSDVFTYDYNDRLVESTVGGVLTQYKYDGFGNRLVKIEGGTTTRYVQDINGSLNNVLAETDAAGAITAYYVYGLGLISKVLPDGTAHYYHYDSRGSTIAITDAGENITDSYAYDPFGNVVNHLGTTANPFRYVGRYGLIDEGNGLTYIRARYYVPELGRFITKDPLTGKDGDSQSLNRYVYAVNNPVMLVDISGFSVQEGGTKHKDGESVIGKFIKSIKGEVSASACLLVCREVKIVEKNGKWFEISSVGLGLAAEAKIIDLSTLLDNSKPLEEGEFVMVKSSGSLGAGAKVSGGVEWLNCKEGGGWSNCQFFDTRANFVFIRGEGSLLNLSKEAKGGLSIGLGIGLHILSVHKVKVKQIL